MKKIVLLGGGFGGVACGLELAKRTLPDCEIILINDHEYHVLHFALYQAATNEQPSRDIAIPLVTIFENKPIKIKIGKVEKLLPTENKITLKNGEEIIYDYLVLALGAETQDYHIPGVLEYTLPLKTLYDAAILRNQVKLLFENACNDKNTILPLKICVGGGGFTGTELAGELHKYADKLARQFGLRQDCFEVFVVQSGGQLLNGLDKPTAQKAQERLESLHVKVILGSHITKVEKNSILLENGQTLPFSLLVWTVGIKGNSLAKNSGLKTDKAGKLAVDAHLRLLEHANIFACGDLAFFPIDSTGNGAPAVAPVAISQGKIVAKNLVKLVTASPTPLSTYEYHSKGYIVPISGKFALARLELFNLDGFPAFVVLQLNVLKYLLSILSPLKALHRWNTYELELSNED